MPRYFLIDSTNGLPARASGYVDLALATERAQESANYLKRTIAILEWTGCVLELKSYVSPEKN